MISDLFFRRFSLFVSAPNGVSNLRNVILQLAFSGKLAPQDSNETFANQLVENVREHRKISKEKNTEIGRLYKFELDQLPVGWALYQLNDIVKWKSGKKKPDDWQERPDSIKQIPVIGGNGVMGYSAETLSNQDIIVVGRVGSFCGCVHTVKGPSWVTDNALYSDEWLIQNIDLEYISNYLDYFKINRFRKSTGQPLITQAILKRIVVPVPPLKEQRRIVSKIERLLKKCDELDTRQRQEKLRCIGLGIATLNALENASNAGDLTRFWSLVSRKFDSLFFYHENISTLREAVLQLAMRGGLVRNTETFTDPKIAKLAAQDKWVSKKLGAVVTFNYGKALPKDKRDANGKIPVYGSNGIVGFHSLALTSGPCIIIGRKGSVGAVNVSKVPCWPIDTTYYVEPPEGIDLCYLFYLLVSLNLNLLDKSTAIPGLNRHDAYSQDVCIPPLREQISIVSKLDKLMSLCDQLEKKILQSQVISASLADSVMKSVVV